MKRTVFPTVPPRVDYELTPLGHAFIAPLHALVVWMVANGDAMAEANRAHAKKVEKRA